MDPSKRSVLICQQTSYYLRCWRWPEARQGAQDDKERLDERTWRVIVRSEHLQWLSWAAADELLPTWLRVFARLCKARECNKARDHSKSESNSQCEGRESRRCRGERNWKEIPESIVDLQSLTNSLCSYLQPLSPFSETQKPPRTWLRDALEACEACCIKLKNEWRSCEIVRRQGTGRLRFSQGLKEEQGPFPQEEIVWITKGNWRGRHHLYNSFSEYNSAERLECQVGLAWSEQAHRNKGTSSSCRQSLEEEVPLQLPSHQASRTRWQLWEEQSSSAPIRA